MTIKKNIRIGTYSQNYNYLKQKHYTKILPLFRQTVIVVYYFQFQHSCNTWSSGFKSGEHDIN